MSDYYEIVGIHGGYNWIRNPQTGKRSFAKDLATRRMSWSVVQLINTFVQGYVACGLMDQKNMVQFELFIPDVHFSRGERDLVGGSAKRQKRSRSTRPSLARRRHAY